MAPDIEEIAKILNAMRDENEANVENFEKVLTGINTKLQMISEDNEETDLIKVYISELKNLVADNYNDFMGNFKNAEVAFGNIITSQKEVAKSVEVNGAFNNLKEEINNFSIISEKQKDSLFEIEQKLDKINTTVPDKHELSEVMSSISANISQLNNYVSKNYENIGQAISDLITSLNNFNLTDNFNMISAQIQVLSSTVKNIPQQGVFDNLEEKISAFKTVMDSLKNELEQIKLSDNNVLSDKFSTLEEKFDTIISSDDFSSFKTDLADFVQKIIDNCSALNYELSSNKQNIENILNQIKSLDFSDNFQNITYKINEVKEAFEQGSNINYSNLSSEILKLAEQMHASFDNLDVETQKIYSSFKEELTSILVNLQKILEVNPKKLIEDLQENLKDVRNGIGSDIQSDYGDLKASVGSVLSSLQAVKNELFERTDIQDSSNSRNFELIQECINKQTEKIEGIYNSFSDTGSENASQVIEAIDKLNNDISALVTNINDNENSNYEAIKAYIEELNVSVNNLQLDFNEKAENNSKTIIDAVKDVASDISNLRDEFKQTVSADLENSSKIIDCVSNVVSKIDGIENSLKEDSKINLDALKSILENISKQLSNDIASQYDVLRVSNDDNNANKLELLQNLANDIKNIESLSQANSEAFKVSVRENILEIKEYIDDVSKSIHSSHTDNNNKLILKLEALDALNHAFDASVITINSEIKKIQEQIGQIDLSVLSEELKNEAENIKSSLYMIISGINSGNDQNGKVIDLITELREFLASKEDVNSLSVLLMNKFVDSCEEIKSLINNSDIDRDNKYKAIIEGFESSLAGVLSVEDFQELKDNFNEFAEKMLNNLTILHTDSDINREKLFKLIENINSLDYSDKFDSLNQQICVVQNSFENSSQKNYENIISKIEDVKNELRQNIISLDEKDAQKLEKLDNALSSFSNKIKEFENISSNIKEGLVDDITNSLNVALQNLEEEIDTKSVSKLDDLKITIANVKSEIFDLKGFVSEKAENVKSDTDIAFDNLKLSVDSILESLNSYNDGIKNLTSDDLKNIFDGINDLSIHFEGLKDELKNLSTEYLAQICNDAQNISDKIELLSNDIENKLGRNFESAKDMFDGLIQDLTSLKDNILKRIDEKNEEKILELTNHIISSREDFKSCVEEISESLKTYIANLDAAETSARNDLDNKLTEKLLNLEADLVNSGENYERKLELLQGKISEFAHIIENSNSDTEAKIASSLDEIADVKTELSMISDVLKSLKISADEKFTENISIFESGIDNIINNINKLNDSLSNGFTDSIKENLESVEDKFNSLMQQLNEIKDNAENDDNDIYHDLEEKISGLKQEIGLVNTDIADALQNKSEEIIRAFDPIKTAIDEFAAFDYEKILSEIKSHLEESFVKFTVDINGEFAQSSEAISKLEQAYKETFNKISVIEDYVSEKIEADIELLKVNYDQNTKDLKSTLSESFVSGIDALKDYLNIILANDDSNEKIKELKAEMSNKFDTIMNTQNSIETQTNVLSAKMNTLGDDLKNYIQDACENTIDKYRPIEAKQSIDALHEKMDVLVLSSDNNDILDLIEDSNENSERRHQNLKEHINNSVNSIGEKINGISQTEDKVSEMLTTLHEKVDILAMDGAEFDLEEEIEDIKELIFEQRKFFDVTSDEKAAQIDKYLRDVLLKLDNVDLEKNSEDIKESIMNALVSLVDQISFVEETEEIKDFVEEKTDAINQNLIEVQNQLRQIASSNDDFGYSYTLQDVESDIAKLRLAINNMSGSDFEGFSEDIKKIVKSVEGLENSLTQDQIVDLKGDIEKLNEDILSISTRTNKLLLTSDESYKTLNDGLSTFNSLIFKLEDRIDYLDKSEITERIEKKIDNIQNMSLASANANKVFQTVMTYMGEWIDSTTDKISDITEKTSEIELIKDNLAELKDALPDKAELINNIESKFEQQEERIDRLEVKLEKILSLLEEKDDMMLNRKVDKIEKLISRLGTNIEKLASYVDEE